MKKIKFIFVYFVALTLNGEAFAAQEKKETIAQLASKSCCETGFADIVEKLLPAVVSISTVQLNKKNQDFDLSFLDDNAKGSYNSQDSQTSSIGSGFVISKDGYVVTNNHVVEDAKEVSIILEDGSKYKARLVGVDAKTDLALLKVDSKKEFAFVKFGDSTKSRIGDIIIVAGNPYNLGVSVSSGIISSNKRTINQIEDFIQTDAAINKGSSGGPMFNLKGEVIGVSSSLFSPSGGSVGIGFAAPSAIAKPIIDQLKDRGEVVRGWIGVSVQDLSEEIVQSLGLKTNKGAFVIEVTKNSPAEIAGILQADIITKFGDIEIIDMKTLPKIIAQSPVDKTFAVNVVRQGKNKILQIKIARMPDESKKEAAKNIKITDVEKEEIDEYVLGIGLAENKDKENAVTIADLKIDSAAKEAGLALKDIIISANQTKIKSIKDLKLVILASKKTNKKLLLLIKRGTKNVVISLSLK